MKIKILTMLSLSLLMLVATVSVNGQSKEITGLRKVRMNAIGTMMDKGHVKGYYAYYMLEKADKKNTHYMLEVMDNNLKTTHSVDFVKPKNTYLLDGEFNGTHFCFAFLNQKLKMAEYEIYDSEGKATGSYQVKDLSAAEMQMYYIMAQSETGNQSLIYSALENGFLINRTEKNKGYKFILEQLDNTGKVNWAANSGIKDKSYEAGDVYSVNGEFAVASITIRPKMLSTKGFTTFINVYNVAKGDLIAKLDLKSNINYLAPSGASFSEKDNEIMIYGEYFGMKGGKPDMKDKKGFFVNIYDNEGNVKSENLSSWQGEIAKKVPTNQKGRMEGGRSIFIHKMVKTSDGNYYVVAEQYKKNVSGLGVASRALGGGGSLAKIDVFNMMIFSFDKDMKLTDVSILEKNKSAFQLPEGYGTVSTEKLGYIVKAYGGFDYTYTTMTNDDSNFNTIYLDYNRGKENKGSRFTVGAIGLSDGKVTESKIKLTTQPFSFTTLPAKPGYITIFEYFKKEKKVSLRLEKLDL